MFLFKSNEKLQCESVTVSSINGSGTGELLDAIVDEMPPVEENAETQNDLPRFAVVGRPIPNNKHKIIVNNKRIITLSLAIDSITIIKFVLKPVDPTAPTITPAVAIAIPTQHQSQCLSSGTNSSTRHA